MRLTFRAWLRSAKVTDDGAGDLIGDQKRDPDLSRGIASRHDLYRAVEDACDNERALRQVDPVWDRYEARLKKEERERP